MNPGRGIRIHIYVREGNDGRQAMQCLLREYSLANAASAAYALKQPLNARLIGIRVLSPE